MTEAKIYGAGDSPVRPMPAFASVQSFVPILIAGCLRPISAPVLLTAMACWEPAC